MTLSKWFLHYSKHPLSAFWFQETLKLRRCEKLIDFSKAEDALLGWLSVSGQSAVDLGLLANTALLSQNLEEALFLKKPAF